MPINTPEPRLPLEPEEYPLYRPPSRIGCSALSIIVLLFVFVFAILFWKVTPQAAKAIVDVPRGLIPGAAGDISSSDTTPVSGTLSTQTVVPQTTPTLPLIATPTPNIEYVQVANTSGQGVRLRDQPSSGKYSVVVQDGAVLEVVGSDVTNSDGTWRHVQLLPPDGRSGYILSNFLMPSKHP